MEKTRSISIIDSFIVVDDPRMERTVKRKLKYSAAMVRRKKAERQVVKQGAGCVLAVKKNHPLGGRTARLRFTGGASYLVRRLAR